MSCPLKVSSEPETLVDVSLFLLSVLHWGEKTQVKVEKSSNYYKELYQDKRGQTVDVERHFMNSNEC